MLFLIMYLLGIFLLAGASVVGVILFLTWMPPQVGTFILVFLAVWYAANCG